MIIWYSPYFYIWYFLLPLQYHLIPLEDLDKHNIRLFTSFINIIIINIIIKILLLLLL